MGNGQQLIVAVLKDEIRVLKSKIAIDCTIHFKPATLYRGLLFNKEVELLITGVGKDRMKKGLEQTLAHQIPNSILYVGYAGGTSPVAGLGSLVLVERVVDERSRKHYVSAEEFLQRAKKLCEVNKWNYHVGGMVTVDKVISSPHEKADLGAVHKAVALDMESAAVAEVATRHGIPWLVVKSVLDPVEMELPNLQDCVEPTGEAKPIMMMEHLFKKPEDLMKLPKIQYYASEARKSITQFVEGWIQSV